MVLLIIDVPFAGTFSVRRFRRGLARPEIGDRRFPATSAHKDGRDLRRQFQLFRWLGSGWLRVLAFCAVPGMPVLLPCALSVDGGKRKAPRTALGSSTRGTAPQTGLSHRDLLHGLR